MPTRREYAAPGDDCHFAKLAAVLVVFSTEALPDVVMLGV